METDTYDATENIFRGTFDSTDITFIVIFAFLFVCALLVPTAKNVYFSLNQNQLDKLKGKGNERIFRLLKQPELLSATIQITNTFIQVGIVIISNYWFSTFCHFTNYPITGFVVQALFIGFIILFIAEIIPLLYRNWGQEKIAVFMAIPLLVLTYVFRPLSALLLKLGRHNPKSGLSMEQLSKALEYSEDEELNEEKDMLEGIVRFSNINAIDIIQPRINIIALDIEDDFNSIKNTVIQHGYSRMPVFREDLDSIEGILYAKDLLGYLQENSDFKWQSLIRPAYFVPETKKIDDLLEEFQLKKVHMAIVVDEYGGTSGIVTMEDILEEIVGEINDEYDEKEENFIRLKNNAYIFEASTLLNDFIKIIDAEPDSFKDIEGEADTLAGLILEIKGEMPKKSEVIIYKCHKFTILEVDNRRIKKIKYERLPA
ncbi:MAG TPA: gliding motility-associated protein GldE [Candidatus Odoribacter faecigallinarum]|uniref:Gliding motility-associated protein GldE n=1 Tax=Candidatus Odoribacter faecigallinarum TaxID=2838706 RepID=A0A9D2AAX1_9BACT|nr:gliding motility-associated protein GldE [Candidatus Odoribacter faecigallinarum]